MFNKLFTWFENQIETYPNEQPQTPKAGLLPFIYDATKGMRFGQRKAVQLSQCFASQS